MNLLQRLSLLVLLSDLAPLALAQTDRDEFFENRIRPVLVRTCFKCHGGDEINQGLRVDSRAALLVGGESGPAIIPRNAEKSLLIQAIAYKNDNLKMPPTQPLSKQVVEDFSRWIEKGATWPKALAINRGESHWAFQPLRDVGAPPAWDDWSNHPVDRFLARAWKERQLVPVPQADPRVLLRRVYFDLIGLPPSPTEIQDFEHVAAHDPKAAFEGEIDRLLASPRYGERWGRHWMDVVRYADTAGDNADYPVPEAQRYRDYIIDAFNADMPFDQFLREQLAGDILARQETGDRYTDMVTATGFLALSRRFGTAPYELWHLTLEDTIDTLGRAFMGLTLKCARCHDHKFDPVTTKDYYALYGIFDSTQFPWAGGEEFQSKKLPRQHFVPLLPDKQAAPRLARYQSKLNALSERMAQLEKQVQAADQQKKPNLQKQLDALRADHLRLIRPGLPTDILAAYAVQEGKPRNVPIQISGVPANSGDVVARNAISFLCTEPLAIPEGQSGRLQLAQWITDPEHPLTARVMVNRIWQQHFGSGIVATPSNFGISGSEPTHPQLLDYLTRRFIDSGWSVKQLHRLILTSKIWQLSSGASAKNASIDTGNDYYWRHNRRRLDAEAIRDAMLSASGMLNLDRPEPHPFPPIAEWHWTQHNQFKDRYESSHRSVFLMTQRIQKHPFLELFDGPDTNTTTAKRTTATVTPQSLYLMNSPEFVQIASAFSDRLISATVPVKARIELAYLICYGRRAQKNELKRDERYIQLAWAALSRENATANFGERDAWLSYAKILLSSNEFLYLD